MPDIIKSSGEPIENLAQEVRESLQLGPPLLQANAEANRNPIFKMKTIRKHKRNCPYGAPPSSRANCDSRNSPKSQLRKWNHQRRRYPSTCLPGNSTNDQNNIDLEDPLQMLQELISDGSLIKEAVKRLQDDLFRKKSTKTFYESEDEEGNCTPDS